MKLTRDRLKQIIKEELEEIMSESAMDKIQKLKDELKDLDTSGVDDETEAERIRNRKKDIKKQLSDLQVQHQKEMSNKKS
jgi:hypothetical protein